MVGFGFGGGTIWAIPATLPNGRFHHERWCCQNDSLAR